MTMTNEELFEDLKQYMDARFSQQDASIDRRFDEVDKKFDSVHQRLDDLSQKVDNRADEILDAVGDTIIKNTDALQEQISQHDIRIGRLEAA